MLKSTTQKQKDSESDGDRQDIRQTGEAYTSNIIRKKELSNAAMNTISQSSILVTGNADLKWQRNFEDLKLAVDRLQIRAATGQAQEVIVNCSKMGKSRFDGVPTVRF